MLKLDDLHVYYGDAHVLHGVSLEIGERETFCVLGPNGAGKSTLLKTIAGAIAPRSGSIAVEGSSIDRAGTRGAIAAGISLVPEGRRVFQSMSVRENLLVGAHSRRDRNEVERDVDMMYEIFPILFEKRHQPGRAMSGGQQQMLAIARGLMSRPRLLLLDEPSLGLAPIIVNELPSVLRKARDLFDTAVLIVEQNAALAFAVATRGFILETGRVRRAGSVAELRSTIESSGLFGADDEPSRHPAVRDSEVAGQEAS